MEKQMDFNHDIILQKLRFEEVESKMEQWRDSQTRGRWAKYYDDEKAINQKEEHQACYLVELVRSVNQHNGNCLPGDEWHIHSWYNRWIDCSDGTYFLTVARLQGESDRTRVFLGSTLVSRLCFRKDTSLAAVQSLVRDTLLGMIDRKPGESLSHALDTLMESPNPKIDPDKIVTVIQLEGLDYVVFYTFLRRLEAWTKRLDALKSLGERASEKCKDWMDYFLHSGCSVVDFYKENRSYAPDGFYGMFRKAL